MVAFIKTFKVRMIITTTLFFFCGFVGAQEKPPSLDASKLSELTLEELMDIRVTTVSMRPEKQAETGGAIQVITDLDIHRSAATRLPEALRLAGNLQTAQVNAHDWAITARGFNGLPSSGGILANKLLVVIDGRSIYNPLFGGVYWDVQNTLLEDIDRIEVVSGPGATFWGVNAMNGIINIITKSAKETQGLYATVAGGSLLNNYEGVRVGARSLVDTSLYFRLYTQHFHHRSTELDDGTDAKDEWETTQGGFRMDYYPSDKTVFTLQGDVYEGESNFDSLTRFTTTDGENVLARLSHQFENGSDLKLFAYFDRTFRNTPNSILPFFYRLYTYELNMQHSVPLGMRNNLLYGITYRLRQDEIPRSLKPLSKDMPLYVVFVQNEFMVFPDKLRLYLGSKFLHNDYTGFEFQPWMRASLFLSGRSVLWGSFTRALRLPSRFDADYLPGPEKFRSEKLLSNQLGYRFTASDRAALSFAAFYNFYDDLRSFDSSGNPVAPLVIANNQKAQSWGFEYNGLFQILKKWRVRGGYTFFDRKFQTVSDAVLPISEEIESVDPKNIFIVQSMLDINRNLAFDLTGRYVDVLKGSGSRPGVPAYFTYDARIAWQWKQMEISALGINLMKKEHIESGRSKIPRSFRLMVTCKF